MRRTLNDYIIKDKKDKGTVRIVLAESPQDAIELFILPTAHNEVYAVKMR